MAELGKATPARRSLAHGFERSRSIMTNASLHKRRRYVLNLDLEDFFPTINFGRVRGFFIKDRNFALREKVATVIAQIACHDNELPQGSPCSPVISNLVGHLLDTRLARFAKIHKCTFSRYADDITFSTNRKDFPAEIAFPVPGAKAEWQLGTELIQKIEHSGFKINNKKTRMQLRGSRQVTTGLLVNDKVNIRPEYYRMARSMCCQLFSTGSYFRLMPATLSGGTLGTSPIKDEIKNLGPLEGMLNHIHLVKDFSDRREPLDKKKHPTAIRTLYSRFLFYKHFVWLGAPLVLPEGKTDIIYLQAAIQMLSTYHPLLGAFKGSRFENAIRFMRYTRTVHNIMQIGGGTGDMKHLILQYTSTVKIFKHAPLNYPVILLIDNDDGAKEIFSVVRSIGGPTITLASADLFYPLGYNLYLVKTPETGTAHESCIEDLFSPALLKTIIDGKTFDRSNKPRIAPGKYGKVVFAEKVVKPNIGTIDFTNFASLLDRIAAVVVHYAATKAASPIKVAV